MSPDETKAMTEARDLAQQTPPDVRTALLAGPREVAGVAFQPLSLGTLWLLEEVDNSLLKPNAGGDAQLSMRDLVAALFIFAHPDQARGALQGGREEFDAQAQKFSCQFSPALFPQLTAVISTLVSEGLATAPVGGGKPNP